MVRPKLSCKRPSTNPVAKPTSPTPPSQPSPPPIQVPSSPSQPAPQPLSQSKVPINVPKGYKVKSIPKRDPRLYRATMRSQKPNPTSDSVPPPSASKRGRERTAETSPLTSSAKPPKDNSENRDQELVSAFKIIKAQNDYIVYAFQKISKELGVTLDPPPAI
ncbi:uncharacterized protein G2W53_011176 [Senna tora]|uniref:Uncharacterized protein n=1 Tax=Senna tora TaxID=362788 RepID=A0A834X119_9FABA|nr:uncharacterized protein G2W53_011176 [Senna tora]